MQEAGLPELEIVELVSQKHLGHKEKADPLTGAGHGMTPPLHRLGWKDNRTVHPRSPGPGFAKTGIMPTFVLKKLSYGKIH